MTFRINPENLDFELPSGLIAQEPPRIRTDANLMVLDRARQEFSHKKFSDLPQFLSKGDVLVLNKTRVNRAKFFGKKKTGGKVEIIFIEPSGDEGMWKALVRPQLNPGTSFFLEPTCEVLVGERFPDGEYVVSCRGFDLNKLMEEKGLMPLPPYIKRSEMDPRNSRDVEDYQTVFGEVPGAIAAPTAALHFTPELLATLTEKGVEIIPLVLHVGWGTFKPVSTTISAHRMLPEKYEIKRENFERLLSCKNAGRRIVGVGTTVTRVLESLPMDMTKANLSGTTDIFITPGFKFRWLDGLITNFHVPRSTPIALTAAFAGLDLLTFAYASAIEKKYQFFSYGDAMLIL